MRAAQKPGKRMGLLLWLAVTEQQRWSMAGPQGPETTQDPLETPAPLVNTNVPLLKLLELLVEDTR